MPFARFKYSTAFHFYPRVTKTMLHSVFDLCGFQFVYTHKISRLPHQEINICWAGWGGGCWSLRATSPHPHTSFTCKINFHTLHFLRPSLSGVYFHRIFWLKIVGTLLLNADSRVLPNLPPATESCLKPRYGYLKLKLLFFFASIWLWNLYWGFARWEIMIFIFFDFVTIIIIRHRRVIRGCAVNENQAWESSMWMCCHWWLEFG
jgi:hypothetical protein